MFITFWQGIKCLNPVNVVGCFLQYFAVLTKKIPKFLVCTVKKNRFTFIKRVFCFAYFGASGLTSLAKKKKHAGFDCCWFQHLWHHNGADFSLCCLESGAAAAETLLLLTDRTHRQNYCPKTLAEGISSFIVGNLSCFCGGIFFLSLKTALKERLLGVTLSMLS